MTTYRKRPVEVEARQWNGGAEAASKIIAWIPENDGTASWHAAVEAYEGEDGKGTDAQPEVLAIVTLEGTMRAAVGDWIIRGVAGEFYPCKPDIFAATYEDETKRPDWLPKQIWLGVERPRLGPRHVHVFATEERAANWAAAEDPGIFGPMRVLVPLPISAESPVHRVRKIPATVELVEVDDA